MTGACPYSKNEPDELLVKTPEVLAKIAGIMQKNREGRVGRSDAAGIESPRHEAFTMPVGCESAEALPADSEKGSRGKMIA